MGVIREHVDIGDIPAGIGTLDLREPPSVLCHDYPGIYSGIKLRPLFSASPGDSNQIQSPSRMPYLVAVSGWISTIGSGLIALSHGSFDRQF